MVKPFFLFKKPSPNFHEALTHLLQDKTEILYDVYHSGRTLIALSRASASSRVSLYVERPFSMGLT